MYKYYPRIQNGMQTMDGGWFMKVGLLKQKQSQCYGEGKGGKWCKDEFKFDILRRVLYL
jgi:hypothetical protein